MYFCSSTTKALQAGMRISTISNNWPVSGILRCPILSTVLLIWVSEFEKIDMSAAIIRASCLAEFSMPMASRKVIASFAPAPASVRSEAARPIASAILEMLNLE